ncbi:MAG: hypothetical protein L3K15_09535, partial [Thermoplasmata archaeon]|nr:hypothetical protein [Thermoplasmata archaeon]
MKLIRLLPMLFGAAILLFGIYLVSTNGSVAGYYLPQLLGLPACNSNTNSTGFPTPGCGFSPFGLGIGTVVVIFGLGVLATSVRAAMSSAAMGGG